MEGFLVRVSMDGRGNLDTFTMGKKLRILFQILKFELKYCSMTILPNILHLEINILNNIFLKNYFDREHVL